MQIQSEPVKCLQTGQVVAGLCVRCQVLAFLERPTNDESDKSRTPSLCARINPSFLIR